MAPERITFDMIRLSLLFVAVISVHRNQAWLPALNLGNFSVGPNDGITFGCQDMQVIYPIDASPVHPIRWKYARFSLAVLERASGIPSVNILELSRMSFVRARSLKFSHSVSLSRWVCPTISADSVVRLTHRAPFGST